MEQFSRALTLAMLKFEIKDLNFIHFICTELNHTDASFQMQLKELLFYICSSFGISHTINVNIITVYRMDVPRTSP